MNAQHDINFERIAEAIRFIRQNFRIQPGLDEIAAQVHLSPYHFQRMFTDWAGISPKKFLQFLTVGYAKGVLSTEGSTVFDAAIDAGLSGTGRLHDLFISIEGMTPGEFKNGGAELTINFSFAETHFGKLLVASTAKGICHMSFADEEETSLQQLKVHFPRATYHQVVDLAQQNALYIFTQDWKKLEDVRLHLKGTAFQLKVWETLLKIPLGGLSSYRSVAQHINKPGAVRAVGTAIGQNPVAFLIPCHRVIQSTGVIGDYHWGTVRKAAMIGWEAAKISPAE